MIDDPYTKKIKDTAYQLIVLKLFKKMMVQYKNKGTTYFNIPIGVTFEFESFTGICDNLRRLSFELFGTEKYGKVEKHFKNWIYFSGDKLFPVPPPNTKDTFYGCKLKASQYFQNTEDLYKSKHNYKLRISLLEHIIKQVEKKQIKVIFEEF